jgi:hypothetical protein
VLVESAPEPTVLDPVLFAGPIALSAWAGRFRMPGTSAVLRPFSPPPVPAAVRHYLVRILQGGQSAFDKLSAQLRTRLWADPEARQRLLAAGMPPPAALPAPEIQPPRLTTYMHGLTGPYQAACTMHRQQGSDGLVMHTGFHQAAFSDVSWATVAHHDFLRLHPGLDPIGLARLYLAALRS